MDEQYDPATAFHEAGHAVAALALGRPVKHVSALPRRKLLGWCEFGKGSFRPSDDWLEREILIALAGLAAEARHTGIYNWEGATHDQRYALELAVRRAGERQAERLQRRMLAKAENLLGVEENWKAVELIAAELLRCGAISGRTARHLFEQATATR